MNPELMYQIAVEQHQDRIANAEAARSRRTAARPTRIARKAMLTASRTLIRVGLVLYARAQAPASFAVTAQSGD